MYKILEVCFVLGLGFTSHSTIFQSCRDGATASWVEAIAHSDQKANTLARALVEEVVCRVGYTPSCDHTDPGGQFDGNVNKERNKLLGIKKTGTTPYHPESDGMVECYNKSLTKPI